MANAVLYRHDDDFDGDLNLLAIDSVDNLLQPVFPRLQGSKSWLMVKA